MTTTTTQRGLLVPASFFSPQRWASTELAARGRQLVPFTRSPLAIAPAAVSAAMSPFAFRSFPSVWNGAGLGVGTLRPNFADKLADASEAFDQGVRSLARSIGNVFESID